MLKLTALKVAQLNELLRANGATTTGTKAHKVAKLQELLGTDEIDSSELEETATTDELQTQIDGLKAVMVNLTAAISAMNTGVQGSRNEQTLVSNESEIQEPASVQYIQRQPTMTIQDMVGILPDFDPVKGTITSGQFIMKIEQLKQNYKWPEVMVLVAIQHKLKGMAKLWLDAQPVHSSWSDFVQAFYVDFPTGYNTAEVHKTMARRRRKVNEDYVEFYYAMVTIGRQGAVDDLSIITHIISGLNDNSLSKTLAAIRLTSCSDLLTALKNLKATSNP
ncbi:PREDICTED: uncharacterized protein LOC108357747, partial [Rhagoletis zephyria]|uniref:uncharacterized protein LOC108357747 n=1 Tax=Rhagoletis zephyria TaxID=28612 RepID=UPI0008116BB7